MFFETKTPLLAVISSYLTQLPSVLWAERLLIVTPQAKDWPGIIWSSSYLKWTSFTFNCWRKTWLLVLRQIMQFILLQPMGTTHIQWSATFRLFRYCLWKGRDFKIIVVLSRIDIIRWKTEVGVRYVKSSTNSHTWIFSTIFVARDASDAP